MRGWNWIAGSQNSHSVRLEASNPSIDMEKEVEGGVERLESVIHE